MKFAEFKMPKNNEHFEHVVHLQVFSPTFMNSYYGGFETTKKEYKQMLRLKDKFEQLLKDYDNLSNIEFFELFKIFYRVPVNKIKQDILTSMFNNPKKYTIKSNDIIENMETEGHGRDFSWWTEYFRAEYVVYAEDGSLDLNKVYTKQEIKELAKCKKIIIMAKQPYGKEIHPQKKEIEQLKEIVVLDIIPYNLRNYFDYDGMDTKSKASVFDEYTELFNIIRKDLSKKEVMEDYKKFMKVFKMHIQSMKLEIQKQKQAISERVGKLQEQVIELDELERNI